MLKYGPDSSMLALILMDFKFAMAKIGLFLQKKW